MVRGSVVRLCDGGGAAVEPAFRHRSSTRRKPTCGPCPPLCPRTKISQARGQLVGAVVELDKLAGDPVDVYVNDQLIARGEVLVLNDNFCIRISEIVASLEESEQVKAIAVGESSE